MTLFSLRPNDSSVQTTPARGLPPRAYLPIVIVIAGLFLWLMAHFLQIGFGSSGSALGQSTAGASRDTGVQQPQNVGVGGGPPPAVRAQLDQLRARIAADPKDDVALVQLGDLYLAVQKYAQAIPLYKRALSVNPKNVAAKAGLEEASTGLSQEQR